MTNKINTIDEYIQEFNENIRIRLQKIRSLIHKFAPNAEEAMTYGIPTFKLNGNLVHFAGFDSHIGFYPTPSGISHFKEELSDYIYAKGSVQFPHNKPLPVELITRIVKFRIEENSKQ